MATNKDIVINALKDSGITNQYSIAAILAIIDKESGFTPKTEISYANTDNDRIRSIFVTKTSKLSDQEINTLKKDPVKFFNFVYGGQFGNSATEGFTYRGRGFNQLTGKDNYAYYGKVLDLNLVNNPDLVNDPKVAAKVVAAYFNAAFKNNKTLIAKRYKVNNINDFKDTTTAVNAFYNANAGLKKDTSKTTTEGKTKALKKVNSFMNITPTKGLIISLPIVLISAILFYYIKK